MGCVQANQNIIPSTQLVEVNDQENPQTIIETKQQPLSSNTTSIKLSKYLSTIKQTTTLIQQQNSQIRNNIWPVIFNLFQGLYINHNDAIKYLQILSKLFNTTLGLSNQQQLESYSQLGSKFINLRGSILINHQYCLEYINLMISNPNINTSSSSDTKFCFKNLKFQLNSSQLEQITALIRPYCFSNLKSFSFVSIYLTTCIKKLIESRKYTFVQLETKLLKQLRNLQKLYPANTQDFSKNQHYKQLLPDIKMTGCFEIIKFQNNSTSHKNQLIQYILTKVKDSENDQQSFVQLTKNVCLEKGYGYKVGRKIKNQSSIESIHRTIQKILNQQIYVIEFNKLKQTCIKQADDILVQNQNNLLKFVQWQKQKVQELIKDILQKQNELQFDAKDLLRAKCNYNSYEDIVHVVNKLKQDIEQKGFKLISLENRINKHTKDVNINIRLNNTISQLQLVLKQDTITNEFNHKIYELMRSKTYTLITNLFVHNQKWTSQFFPQQHFIYKSIISNKQRQNLRSLTQEFNFTQNMQLFTNLIKDFYNNYAPHLNKYLTQEIQQIQLQSYQTDSLTKVLDMITAKCTQFNSNKTDLPVQLQNQIQLLTSFGNQEIDKLINHCKQDKQLMKNYKIINSIANYYAKITNYDLSNEYYIQSLSIVEVQKTKNSTEYTNILMNIALNYDSLYQHENSINYLNQIQKIYQQMKMEQSQYQSLYNSFCSNYSAIENYQKALQYSNKSVQLSKQIHGNQSSSYQTALTYLASIYDDKRDYQTSLNIHKQCLFLTQKNQGKQSNYCSTIMYNIAYCFFANGNLIQSSTYYKKSLLIKQKIKGKNDYGCAYRLSGLGKVYKQLKDYQNSEISYLRAIQICENSVDNSRHNQDLCSFLQQLGQVYEKTKNYVKGIQVYKRICLIEEKDKSRQLALSKSFLQISCIYKLMSKHEQSLEYLQKGKEIYERYQKQDLNSKDRIKLSSCYFRVGKIYFQSKQYEKAIEYYNKCGLIQKQEQKKQNYSYTLFRISKTYKQMKNNKMVIQKLLQSETILQNSINRKLYKSQQLQILQLLVEVYNEQEMKQEADKYRQLVEQLDKNNKNKSYQKQLV